MTYWGVNAIFLGIAVVVLAVAVLLRRPGRLFWGSLAGAAVLLVVLTAVFDNVMIASGIMTYTEQNISGVRIGLAPLEDFAYPVAGVLLLPALWLLLGREREGAASSPGPVVPRRGVDVLTRLFWASRPLSWVNTAYPFAAAALLTGGLPWWLVVLGTVFFLVPYNLAMYGINDVFDFASDLRNPRKGGVEGSVLGDPAVRRRVLAWSVLLPVPFVAVLAGWSAVRGEWAAVLVLAVSLFAVVAYSWAGLRFKERPFLDAATSATHFVSPAVYGLALAGATPTPALAALLGAFFLWGMASQMFGAVQDVVPDREGGLASVATVLGARRTVLLAAGLYAAAGLLLLATDPPGPLAALLAVPYVVNTLRFRRITDATSGAAHRGWQLFLPLNYVTGFLVTLLLIGWALSRGAAA